MLKKLFRHYDYSIIVTVLLLVTFGLVMVYSASSIWSIMIFKKPSDYIFKKQLMWVIAGTIACLIGMIAPYKMYRIVVKPLTVLSLIALILVLIVGHTSNHAQSWFIIGGLSIQPSEVVKITVIMYLAFVFSNKQSFISDFRTGVLPPLIMISVFFFLIAIQPDLGSAMILAGVAGTIIICSGMRLKHLLLLLGSAAGAISVLFRFLLTGQQASRFTSAYNPFSVAKHGGYQLINSYIAIASGGITGKGLGHSIEKAGFLPEPHTDFIMAIIAEELGLFGVAFVIFGLLYLVVRGIYIGIKCRDVFGSLLAIGISSLIAIQTLVNLGAITGLLPITGVTLPFISYGGSSLIMLMFSIGILINVSAFVNMRRQREKNEERI